MKVLIVDDEAPARERLRQLLEDDPLHSVVGEARNGKEALKAASELDPDVVLLDIRMPGLSGIEAAHHLNEFENPPAVVFTTAFDEYAIEAFDANAVGYVLKPVRRERLQKAMQRAARVSNRAIEDIAAAPGVESTRTHVCARHQGELKLIPLLDINCFHADQKYVRVVHDGGEHLIDDSLKSLETEFSGDFVRVHRSVLVSVARIDSLQKTPAGTRIVMRGAENPADGLIISRRHLANVKKRIKGN